MNMRTIMRAGSPFLIMMLLVTGCNIFDFASDDEKSPTEQAEDAIRDGDYEEAREVLADADSTDAMTMYLSAKVALLESGIDLATIVDLVEGENGHEDSNLPLLDVIDGLSDAEKTAWYQGNQEATYYLRKIWQGQTYGVLEKDDVALDYTVSNMMSGVLGLRDTNRDGAINNNDFRLDMRFRSSVGSRQIAGYNLSGGAFVDESGITSSFQGLEVFLGDWAAAAKPAEIRKGKSGYTPDDINPLIAYVLSVLDEGTDAIMYLIEEQTDTTFDADEIEEYIDEIAAIINFYWYNDGIDNDGDGAIDEETINGIDDDGDGLIDEDSDHHPSDQTPDEDTSYVGVWQKWNER